MKKKIMMTLLVMGMMICGSKLTAKALPARMPDGVLFDDDYYAESNPDLMAAYGRNTQLLYRHYVTCGKAEGRKPLSDKYIYPELPAPASEYGYTIGELLDIYCTIIEANGIKWDPSLKGNWDETIGAHDINEWKKYFSEYNGTGWGTGYLEVYNIERNAYSEVEALRMGDTVGHSHTRYYFEYLGFDYDLGLIEFVGWSA